MRRSLVFVLVAAAVALTTTVAYAGDLYSLDMKLCMPAPAAYPVNITIEVHKDQPGNLKGTTTATFDGTVLSDIMCDDFMCITDAEVDGDMLYLYFDSFGYKDGKYEANSYFDVFVGDVNLGLPIHTSCSKPIYVDGHPYGALPLGAGTFYVLAGDGTCMSTRQGCPPDPNKLQWVYAKFEVACAAPADLVVNVYKDTSDLKGTSGGYFDGMDVSDIYYSTGVTGAVAMLVDAEMDADTMVVYFYAFGVKGGGEFEKNTRFELVVEGCGNFYMDLHTSCSQEINMDQAYDLTPAGAFTFLNGCGSCIGYVPVEDKTWGTIKSLYR